MQTNRFSPARKFLLGLAAALSLLLLSGCQGFVLTNLTAPTFPENPSRIYTISLRVTVKIQTVVPGSIKPYIVVDGKRFLMSPSSVGGEGLYDFDYQLPAGRDELRYYFLVNYDVETNGTHATQEAYSELNIAKVVGRYVLSLEVNRGPIGARISVLGRGFTPQDVVYFDNVPARTVYESSTSLSFFVPATAAGRNYQVMIGSPAGNSPVGTFRVDGSAVSVSPSALTLRTGESQTITFTVPNTAPAGGLLLDVTTDAPEAVIMPEVVVPAGQNSVRVTVQGGRPGSGSLFLKGYGEGEVTIPVTVTAK